jgi:hypothetical protein
MIDIVLVISDKLWKDPVILDIEDIQKVCKFFKFILNYRFDLIFIQSMQQKVLKTQNSASSLSTFHVL